MIFKNRDEAGRRLAQHLQNLSLDHPVILALPRGGVPLAWQISQALGSPWSFLMVRKIGAPSQPELAAGALCEEDDPVWNESLLEQSDVQKERLSQTVKSEQQEIRRQIHRFRLGRPLGNVEGRNVIVADDGLATGATMMAAVRYLRKRRAARIVVAVPVSSASAASWIRAEADDVVAIEEREDLRSVGSWYEDFTQVTDEDVLSYLERTTAERIENMKLQKQEISISDRDVTLPGTLITFPGMKALVVFAQATHEGHLDIQDQYLADALSSAGFGTFSFGLLTPEEFSDRENVFDIKNLARRVCLAAHQIQKKLTSENLPWALFSCSTAAAATLVASIDLASSTRLLGVICRGGRVDLAEKEFHRIKTPTLLLVGDRDPGVLEINQEAQKEIEDSELVVVPGATHLFDEPGTLHQVAQDAAVWLTRQLISAEEPQSPRQGGVHRRKTSEKTRLPQ